MYQDLKKLHHIDEAKAEAVYQARMDDSSVVSFDIAGKTFFYWMAPDVYSRLLDIERIDKTVCQLAASISKQAAEHYITECMIDEIILTNDIEGVTSTRKEIESAMESLKKKDKRKRFQGIVNKYNSLALNEYVPLQTLEDIRAVYDELVLPEIAETNPKNIPDGGLFRIHPVNVTDSAQRIIHQSALSEAQICEELTKGLELYNNKEIEPLVRAALFHFIFAYIHPFYDGNGRMNRFISSQLICEEVSQWAGLRLSFSVKENIGNYYKAFQLVEHALNRGDLTPFIIMFLEIVLDALEKTSDAMIDKRLLFQNAKDQLYAKYHSNRQMDVEGVGEALLQGMLFNERGLTVEGLAKDAGVTPPTVYARLEAYKKAGLLKRERSGRKVYYSLDLEKLG